MQSEAERIREVLGILRDKLGLDGAALVTKDGTVVAAVGLPEEATGSGLFGVMCATMLGAAGAANQSIAQDAPGHVAVASPDGLLAVVNVGSRRFAVLVGRGFDVRETAALAREMLRDG